MPRFIPPHLMVLIGLFAVVIWFMLVHHFRKSTSLQTFVGELLGDDTPENALKNFELARQRLSQHLNDADLDCEMRQRIEFVLGTESGAHGKQPAESCEQITLSNN